MASVSAHARSVVSRSGLVGTSYSQASVHSAVSATRWRSRRWATKTYTSRFILCLAGTTVTYHLPTALILPQIIYFTWLLLYTSSSSNTLRLVKKMSGPRQNEACSSIIGRNAEYSLTGNPDFAARKTSLVCTTSRGKEERVICDCDMHT